MTEAFDEFDSVTPKELEQNEREEERALILVSYDRNSLCLKQNIHKLYAVFVKRIALIYRTVL